MNLENFDLHDKLSALSLNSFKSLESVRSRKHERFFLNPEQEKKIKLNLALNDKLSTSQCLYDINASNTTMYNAILKEEFLLPSLQVSEFNLSNEKKPNALKKKLLIESHYHEGLARMDPDSDVTYDPSTNVISSSGDCVLFVVENKIYYLKVDLGSFEQTFRKSPKTLDLVSLLDARKQNLQNTDLEDPVEITSLTFVNNSEYFAFGDNRGLVELRNFDSGKRLRTLQQDHFNGTNITRQPVYSLTQIGNNKDIIMATYCNMIKFHDLRIQNSNILD
jgi:WD40 repeat protein